jgi:hypothetical protein
MTDTTAPRPLKVFTCYDPTGRTAFCYGLVEDTDETRREHRAWHRHEEAVKRGLRGAITERDDTIASLRQEVADLRGDVKGIELPEAVLGIEINRDGYTEDDDLDEDDDEPEDAVERARADAEAAFTTSDAPTPQVDPSGLYTPAGSGNYGASGTVF